ncbi:hypothetical protein VTN96DRAFT_5433 [Rasamsonia emersonii]
MAKILDYNPSPNYYSNLVHDQRYALISSFTLESGQELHSFPIAFKTWGVLNANHDNVIVVCHALSGSCDIEDWWRPAIGPRQGLALDISRFFVFCANMLGSPYGSASSVTLNPETGSPYGPGFPQTTVRDDVRVQKLVLDALGVASVAAVIGGSMGGMATLEWPLCTPAGYVKSIIPIATAARQSAWGISWSAVQRNCIRADPAYHGGYYNPDPAGQPYAGLATARQVAMLTYRSSVSFERRFGRKPAEVKTYTYGNSGIVTNGESITKKPSPRPDEKPCFAAQSYLQYQGEKFLCRFDANCYLHLIDKMDLHDVARGRRCDAAADDSTVVSTILGSLPSKALVIGVESDILFRLEQQAELAALIPDAELVVVPSQDGHDGFLLEFDMLNEVISRYLKDRFPQFYEGEPALVDVGMDPRVKSSVFGEMESD